MRGRDQRRDNVSSIFNAGSNNCHYNMTPTRCFRLQSETRHRGQVNNFIDGRLVDELFPYILDYLDDYLCDLDEDAISRHRSALDTDILALDDSHPANKGY